MNLFDWTRRHTAQGNELCTTPSEMVLFNWQITSCGVEHWRKQEGNWRKRASFSIDWPAGSSSQEQSAARGELLRSILTKHQIECRLVTVCLPRERIVQKRLELPVVDEALLADAVTLQLESRGIASAEFVSDYIGHDGGTVYTASVPRQMVEEIHNSLNAAELQLHSMFMADCGLANLFPDTDEAYQLLMITGGQRLHCVVARRGMLLTSASFSVPDSSDSFDVVVEGAVDRVTRSLSSDGKFAGFQQAWTLGERAEEGVRILRAKNLTARVLPITPNDSIDSWVCIQQLSAAAHTRIDFFSPKRGPDLQALRRQKSTKLAIRAVLAASLAILLGQLHFQHLSAETKRLEDENRRLQQQLEASLPVSERAAELLAWKELQRNVPAEVARVLNTLPDNDKAYIDSLAIDLETGELAELRMDGVARTLEDALAVNRRLMELGEGYEVRPDQIQQRDSDAYYPVQFSVSLAIDSLAKPVAGSPSFDGDRNDGL